jgi:hypothetical protein
MSDCLTYGGKLEILEKEEQEILARYDVIIWAYTLTTD